MDATAAMSSGGNVTTSVGVLFAHQSSCPAGVSGCGTTANVVHDGSAVNLFLAGKAVNGAYGNVMRVNTGGASASSPNGYQVAYPAFADNLAYGGGSPANDFG